MRAWMASGWRASTSQPLARGQLVVAAAKEPYLRELPFDPDRMVASLHPAVDEALADGFDGFRVTGDMCWGARDVPAAQLFEDYEECVNEVLTTRPASPEPRVAGTVEPPRLFSRQTGRAGGPR